MKVSKHNLLGSILLPCREIKPGEVIDIYLRRKMNYTNDGLDNIANSTTEQPRDNTVQTLQVIAVTLLILITFLGTIGNILVFKAIFSLKKRKINDYLILNLAATDAGTCLVSIPLDAGEKMIGEFPYGAALCHVIYPLQSVLVYVSVMTLLFMCVDRYRLIVTPLKPRIHLRTGIITIVVFWLSSCLIVLPLSLALRLDGSQCGELWPRSYSGKVFTLTIFTSLYAIPLLLMTVLYAFIVRALYKDKNSLRQWTNVSISSRRSASLPTQRNLKIVHVFVAAVVAFAVCMLPTHVTWLWHDFGNGSKQPELFSKVVTFSNILMYANSIVNPIIFGSIDLKILAKICRALICHQSHGKHPRVFEKVFVLRTTSPLPPMRSERRSTFSLVFNPNDKSKTRPS